MSVQPFTSSWILYPTESASRPGIEWMSWCSSTTPTVRKRQAPLSWISTFRKKMDWTKMLLALCLSSARLKSIHIITLWLMPSTLFKRPQASSFCRGLSLLLIDSPLCSVDAGRGVTRGNFFSLPSSPVLPRRASTGCNGGPAGRPQITHLKRRRVLSERFVIPRTVLLPAVILFTLRALARAFIGEGVALHSNPFTVPDLEKVDCQ